MHQNAPFAPSLRFPRSPFPPTTPRIDARYFSTSHRRDLRRNTLLQPASRANPAWTVARSQRASRKTLCGDRNAPPCPIYLSFSSKNRQNPASISPRSGSYPPWSECLTEAFPNPLRAKHVSDISAFRWLCRTGTLPLLQSGEAYASPAARRKCRRESNRRDLYENPRARCNIYFALT